jgi:hypothetical protein
LSKHLLTQSEFDAYFQRVTDLMKKQDVELGNLEQQFDQAKKLVLATSFYARRYSPEEITFIKVLI